MVGKMKNSEVSKKGRVQYKGAGPRVPAYQQFSSSDSEQSDEDDYSEASSYETSVSPEPTPAKKQKTGKVNARKQTGYSDANQYQMQYQMPYSPNPSGQQYCMDANCHCSNKPKHMYPNQMFHRGMPSNQIMLPKGQSNKSTSPKKPKGTRGKSVPPKTGNMATGHQNTNNSNVVHDVQVKSSKLPKTKKIGEGDIKPIKKTIRKPRAKKVVSLTDNGEPQKKPRAPVKPRAPRAKKTKASVDSNGAWSSDEFMRRQYEYDMDFDRGQGQRYHGQGGQYRRDEQPARRANETRGGRFGFPCCIQ